MEQGDAEGQEPPVAFAGQYLGRALLHWGMSPFVLRARNSELVRHGRVAIRYQQPVE